MAGMVDHMAQQMETLQSLFVKSDENRAVVDEKLGKLADAVDRMTNGMQGADPASQALERVAVGQERMIEALQSRHSDSGDGMDAESRMRLRSIDVQMLRILEEISAGRQETMAELRHDISLLATALSGGRNDVPRRIRTPEKPGGGER
jgi:hypothetical protein